MLTYNQDINVYVVSDLHGDLDGFERILSKIKFDPTKDVMYSVGDVIDRNVYGVYLIRKYFMKDPDHFKMVLGNHELMMLESIGGYYRLPKPNDNTCIDIHPNKEELSNWMMNNGGYVTNVSFGYLSGDEKTEFMNFIGELPFYYKFMIGSKKFVVTHSAICNFVGNDSSGFTFQEVYASVWWRGKYSKFPKHEYTVIHGHTPVRRYPEICENGWINIDTGAGHRDGFATCVRLNDMTYFHS